MKTTEAHKKLATPLAVALMILALSGCSLSLGNTSDDDKKGDAAQASSAQPTDETDADSTTDDNAKNDSDDETETEIDEKLTRAYWEPLVTQTLTTCPDVIDAPGEVVLVKDDYCSVITIASDDTVVLFTYTGNLTVDGSNNIILLEERVDGHLVFNGDNNTIFEEVDDDNRCGFDDNGTGNTKSGKFHGPAC